MKGTRLARTPCEFFMVYLCSLVHGVYYAHRKADDPPKDDNVARCKIDSIDVPIFNFVDYKRLCRAR